jgi:hypothetical protein
MNNSLLTSDKPLKVRLKMAGESRVDLVFPDNQVVTISTKYLPRGAKTGDFLYLNLIDEGDLTRTKKQIAQEVLREILNENQ